MRTVTLIRLGIFGILAIGGVVGFIFRDRLVGSASDLRVGDCVQLPTTDGEFKDIQHTPCTEPHDGEIYLLVDYPTQASFPTESEFETFAADKCLGPAFQSYTGLAYEAAQAVAAEYFTPVPAGWSKGDHEVVCYLTPANGGRTSVSYRAGG